MQSIVLLRIAFRSPASILLIAFSAVSLTNSPQQATAVPIANALQHTGLVRLCESPRTASGAAIICTAENLTAGAAQGTTTQFNIGYGSYNFCSPGLPLL